MANRFYHLFVLAALTAAMSPPLAAQEYSNGGKGAADRGPAILTPAEAYGVHPPGLAPADARHWKPFRPYYAPVSPVASSTRWRPWGYFPLLPYYTPYYQGYCPHRLFNPRPRPYGSDGWGKGPPPDAPIPEEAGTTPLGFGPYTSVVEDDTTFWNMGGNGLVPYGAADPVDTRPPDLIDAIQASRPHHRFRRMIAKSPPTPISPPEATGEQLKAEPVQGVAPEPAGHRRRQSDEPLPAEEVLREQGVAPGAK